MRILFFFIFGPVIFFSLSSTAQELRINCKGFHTAKDLIIDDGMKEIEYEEKLHLDLEEKALFWLSIKQYYVFETGIKKEAHSPVVYEKLSPTNLIMLDLDGEKVISFGNAYLDGKLYSMEQFLSMGSPKANIFRSYNYYVNKDSLNYPNSIKITKLMHTETTKLPEINFMCKKIDF